MSCGSNTAPTHVTPKLTNGKKNKKEKKKLPGLQNSLEAFQEPPRETSISIQVSTHTSQLCNTYNNNDDDGGEKRSKLTHEYP